MPDPIRVLLWTDAPAAYLAAIEQAGLSGAVQVETAGRAAPPTDVQLAGAEALLAREVEPGTLPRMKRLRWAQAMTAGVEGWLALPDLPQDLTLTCARGTHRESMPENILAALFHLTKPFCAIVEDQKRSHWARRIAQPLNGKTLGILGLGAVGKEVARLAGALGMRVIGTKRDGAKLPGLAEVFPPEQTDTVLGQSDFVLLLLPATPATENFIDAARLARMKPGAWLLNFGRGALIRDADLIAAAAEKRIAGAVLDVFREEPLPASHPFWTAPGILVLPHIGGPHPNRDAIVARLFAENLGRFVRGEALREVVDRAAGY
ncbi:MAG: D-2-hydroxyacid dehydrogenase [Rhodospirillales bacterium]|nr:D-2-hydroxyacid dehydrogenase [Rhodospirillales bacterium]